MSNYHIKLINQIDQINPQQWNAVTGDTLQQGHRWQKYKQASQATGWPKAWTAFVTVWSDADLVGVATAYQYPMPMPFATPWLRHISKIAMALTNPINFSVLPTVAPFADETAVFPLLIKGMRQLMWRKFALGVRLVFLQETTHSTLLGHLRRANFLVSNGIWENEMRVAWPTFVEYLRCLKKSRRHHVRQQRKIAKEAGVVITKELPEDASAVYALFDNVAHQNRSNLLYNEHFLTHAQQILGTNHFTLLRAIYNGETVACLMMYHAGTEAQLAAIGLDLDISKKYNLYRVLAYAAIEHCIENGIEHIKGGMSQYQIKQRMGFTSFPTLTATDAWLPPVKKGYAFTPSSLQDGPTS